MNLKRTDGYAQVNKKSCNERRVGNLKVESMHEIISVLKMVTRQKRIMIMVMMVMRS